MDGLEPPTFPVSAECSKPTELHQHKIKVNREGLEPSTYALEERCSSY